MTATRDCLPIAKPCPFCGSNDVVLNNTHTASFWCECTDCSATVHGESFKGPHRRTRFSYEPSPHPSVKSEASFEQLHPEYRLAALSACEAWNRRCYETTGMDERDQSAAEIERLEREVAHWQRLAHDAGGTP